MSANANLVHHPGVERTNMNGKGVEWTGTGADESRPERDARGWPILHGASEPCDGKHPLTGRICSRSYHQGYHRDSSGAEWLDD